MLYMFFRKGMGMLVGLVIAFVEVSPARAADGSLDPTFGNGGIVTTNFSGLDDQGMDVEVQPDGKIIVAGTSWNTNSTQNDFALARYDPDGSLDTTFGEEGKVSTDIANSDNLASAVSLQEDGKIVVAGSAYNGHDTDFALVRYNPDGTLDTSFDVDGKVSTAIGNSNDHPIDAVLQPDGKILMTGFGFDDATSNYNIVLARFTDNGSLDTAFGSSGKVILSLDCSASGHAIALQPDGKILVAGDRCGDFALVRLNSDGSPDATFGSDGYLTTDFDNSYDSAYAVALQPDGKIVLAGQSNNEPMFSLMFALARYNSDGSLDLTFDEDGRVTTDLGGWRDFGHALAIQPDGRILVVGEQWHEDGTVDFALARYKSDGSLDPAFDADGIVVTDISSADYPTAVALQSDGRILVAGFSNSGFNLDFDFVLARYDATGSALEATLDVLPGKFPNGIELEKDECKDDDNLPVAILTTPEFDALRLVDATSLKIGDPVLGGSAAPIHSQGRDIDRDGDRDVWLLFALCDLVSNNALDEDTTELVLTGSTLEGGTFTARDSVEIIGHKPPKPILPVFLDPAFGSGGIVTTDFAGYDDFGYGGALQPDSKILVSGSAYNGLDSDFALARYNSDGSLDTTFGTDGKVTTDVSSCCLININTASAEDIEALPGIGPRVAQWIVDYRAANGPFQRIEDIVNVPGIGPGTFNQIKDLVTVGNDYGQGAAVQPDGRIIVVGGSNNDFALARYNSDGSLDTTFGTDGRVLTDIGENSGIGISVALQPDGKILASGFGGTVINFLLVRYNHDGSPDTTFGDNGIVITHISGEDFGRVLALQPDGKIIVAGQSWVQGKGYNFTLVRYNSDGSLDTAFGLNGIVSTGFEGSFEDNISAILLQPDGKIVAAGSSDADGLFKFALARYHSDGSLDKTFGADGKVTTPFPFNDAYGNAAALQPDGRIIVAGQYFMPDVGYTFALAGYLVDGSLDMTFGTDGKIITAFGSGDSRAYAVLLPSDGRIVAAGHSFTGASFDFALARYQVGGSPSPMKVPIDIKPGSRTNPVNHQSRGRIHVAILSTPEFDALTMIDRTTIRFGRTGGEESLHSCKEKGRDVNHDGLKDLVCVFSIRGSGFQQGNEIGILATQTVDGIALIGNDSIRVVREDDD